MIFLFESERMLKIHMWIVSCLMKFTLFNVCDERREKDIQRRQGQGQK